MTTPTRLLYENFRDLHAAGYLALTIPEQYGGQGANVLEYALAQERIARVPAAPPGSALIHAPLAARPHRRDRLSGRRRSSAGICQDVIANGTLINAANSEPDLGSPSWGALLQYKAERTPHGWRINVPRKRWASLAPALTYVYSLATVIDGDTRRTARTS